MRESAVAEPSYKRHRKEWEEDDAQEEEEDWNPDDDHRELDEADAVDEDENHEEWKSEDHPVLDEEESFEQDKPHKERKREDHESAEHKDSDEQAGAAACMPQEVEKDEDRAKDADQAVARTKELEMIEALSESDEDEGKEAQDSSARTAQPPRMDITKQYPIGMVRNVFIGARGDSNAWMPSSY